MTNTDTPATYYHVVCRDCTVESLEESAEVARDVARRHDERTEHRVVVGRV
jgi:hypothetical protein